MSEPTTTGGLAAALAKVMVEAKAVAKGGRNTFDGYEYARDVDICDAARPLLGKHGVAVVVRAIRDLPSEAFHRIEVDWLVMHSSGESTTGMSRGAANKKSRDKADAIALTYARKDFIRTLLTLAAGDDDPEQDAHSEPSGDRRPEPERPPTHDAKYLTTERNATQAAEKNFDAALARLRELLVEKADLLRVNVPLLARAVGLPPDASQASPQAIGTAVARLKLYPDERLRSLVQHVDTSGGA